MIAPLARGLTLRYPLTGLVRCGVCGRSMIPSYSAAQNAAGQKREYVGYRCPAAATAGCENRTGVPEVWLRATVVSALLRRLRLADDWDGEGDALAEIVQLINQELQRRLAARPAIAPGLTSEREAIDRQITGWSQSLARPDLPEVVRRDLEARWAEADGRKREIDNLLSEDEAARRQSEICVDRDAVRERLNCLHEAVAGDNATLANFRLALHVDEIRGYPDGKVQMRLCKLGLLPDAEVLGERLAGPPEDQTERLLHRRRRGRLAIEGADEQEEDQLYFATDPDRFADLGDEWFWIETYQIPPRLSWSEEHARAVAEHRLATKQTMAKTAVHFGVTVPTIRAALRIAKEQFGIDAIGKELSLPTRPNWPRDNAQAVATFLSQPGMKRKDAAAHFKKSLSWIKRALDLAREQPDPEAAGGPPSGEAA